MCRILVAEDDVELGDALIRVLQGAGYDAQLAQSGRGVLDQIEREAFDVIVTDILMPDADGIEVIKAARAADPDVKIVAISGGGYNFPASVSLKLSEAFGADRVLYKPFRTQELFDAIKQLCVTPSVREPRPAA